MPIWTVFHTDPVPTLCTLLFFLRYTEGEILENVNKKSVIQFLIIYIYYDYADSPYRICCSL